MTSTKKLFRIASGAFCTVLLSHYFVNQAAAANPPAQGPMAASTSALSAPTAELSGILRGTIDKIVAAENASLAANPDYHAVITDEVQALTPSMAATTYPNQPNQFYAYVPFTVTYHVNNIQANIGGVWVPYFGRDITQEIDIHATCEGWYTGSGTLTYTAIPQPPKLVGDLSPLEQALGALLLDIIPNYVNRVVAEQLQNFSSDNTVTSSGASCRSLGVATRAQGFPFDSIEYDPSVIHLPNTTPSQQITVRVTQVHRLAVHDSENVPVYHPIEVPHFDFYAGFSHLRMQFPAMRENDTVTFTQNNSVQTPVPPNSGLLVLIGNLSSGNDDVNADYNFVTFGSATHFGDGTHTFAMPKHWTQPTAQPGTRSLQATANGYLITLQITTPASQGTVGNAGN